MTHIITNDVLPNITLNNRSLSFRASWPNLSDGLVEFSLQPVYFTSNHLHTTNIHCFMKSETTILLLFDLPSELHIWSVERLMNGIGWLPGLIGHTPQLSTAYCVKATTQS